MSKIKGFAAVLAAVAMVFVGNSAHADAPQPGWTAEHLTADPSCIRTDGNLVYAYAAGNYTANGVHFSAISTSDFPCSDIGWTRTGLNTGKTCTVPGVTGGYADVMQHLWSINGVTQTITLKNLTAGRRYLVQIIGCNQGGNDHNTDVYVDGYESQLMRCGASAEGWPYGGTLIGVFDATDSTYSFDLKFADTHADWVAYNAIQVRDITPPVTYVVTKATDDLTNPEEGSLREVLTRAYHGDTVTFDDSLRGQTITIVGVDTAKADTSLVIDKAITIEGNGVIIDGGWDGVNKSSAGGRIFYIPAGLTKVTFKDITLQNGHGRGWAGGNGWAFSNQYFAGGAVCALSPVRFESCRFYRNYADDDSANNATDRDGGAIHAESALELFDCEFDSCGGGNGNSQYAGAVLVESGSLIAKNVVASNCTAGSFGGGFLVITSDSSLFCENMVIEDAFGAYAAGAIRVHNTVNNGSSVTRIFKNCAFHRCFVKEKEGGAILADGPAGRFVFDGCEFEDCGAQWGGAVRLNGAYGIFVNCTIRKCSGDQWGPALDIRSGASFANCTLAGCFDKHGSDPTSSAVFCGGGDVKVLNTAAAFNYYKAMSAQPLTGDDFHKYSGNLYIYNSLVNGNVYGATANATSGAFDPSRLFVGGMETVTAVRTTGYEASALTVPCDIPTMTSDAIYPTRVIGIAANGPLDGAGYPVKINDDYTWIQYSADGGANWTDFYKSGTPATAPVLLTTDQRGIEYLNGRVPIGAAVVTPDPTAPYFTSPIVSTSDTGVEITLSGITVGTDATAYDVYVYEGDNAAAAVKVAEGQTGATVTFALDDLSLGAHTYSVYLKNDRQAQSDTRTVSVLFEGPVTDDPNGSWVVSKLTANASECVVNDGKLLYAFARGNARLVNDVMFVPNSYLNAATDQIEVSPVYNYEKDNWNNNCSAAGALPNGDWKSLLGNGWLMNSDAIGASTFTFKGLTKGATYKAQLLVHEHADRDNPARSMFPPGMHGVAGYEAYYDQSSNGEHADWDLGSSMVGRFVATGAVHQLKFSYSNKAVGWKCLNAIQLREIRGPQIEPEPETPYEVTGEHKTIVDGDYVVYVWKNPSQAATITIPSDVKADYLVVGGGGAGGYCRGGGGGGGGVVYQTMQDFASGTYTITVGAGGVPDTFSTDGACYQKSKTSETANGGSSSISFSSAAICEAFGGGGGGNFVNGNVANSIGLGYEAGVRNVATGGGSAGKNTTAPAGYEGQGFAGGAAYGAKDAPSGGGGGAGSAGLPATGEYVAGNGGDGISCSITGTEAYYGGGGGGGLYGDNNHRDGVYGVGGLGGGGRGGSNQNGGLTPGTDGLGGGGGGASGFNNRAEYCGGAPGGSGTVIIRLPIDPSSQTVPPSFKLATPTVDGRSATISLNSVVLGTDSSGEAAATSYDVYAYTGDDPSAAVKYGEGLTAATATFTLTGLEPGDYTYNVYVVNNGGLQSRTLSVAFIILPAVTPSATLTPTVSGTDVTFGFGDVVIGTDAESHPAGSYCILLAYAPQGEELPELQVIVADQTSATYEKEVLDLDESTTYAYTAIVSNDLGNVSASITGTFTTGIYIETVNKLAQKLAAGEWVGVPMTGQPSDVVSYGEEVLGSDGKVRAYINGNLGTDATISFVNFRDGWNTSDLNMVFGSGHKDYGDAGTTGCYVGLMKWGWYGDNSGDDTYTLHNLVPGQSYLIQIIVHDGRTGNSGRNFGPGPGNIGNRIYFGEATKETALPERGGVNWYYGGTLIHAFVATDTTYSFVLNCSDGAKQINAIQLRAIPPPKGSPKIGTLTTAVEQGTAMVSLGGVAMGTDDEAQPATSYDVYVAVDDADPVKVLAEQESAPVSFFIQNLAVGEHDIKVFIENNFGAVSPTNSAAVAIVTADPDCYFSIGNWRSLPMTVDYSGLSTFGALNYALASSAGGNRIFTVNTIPYMEAYRDVHGGRTYYYSPYFTTDPVLNGENDNFGTEDTSGDALNSFLRRAWTYRVSSGASGQMTITLKQLEPGARYMVQLTAHNNRTDTGDWSHPDGTMTAPDGVTAIQYGTVNEDNTWKYGGSLIGSFVASNTTHAFTFTYSPLTHFQLNTIQVRKTGDAPAVVTAYPTLGDASVFIARRSATLTVSGLDAGVADGTCDIYYALAEEGQAFGAYTLGATGVTDESCTFALPGIERGKTYIYSVYAVNPATKLASLKANGSFAVSENPGIPDEMTVEPVIRPGLVQAKFGENVLFNSQVQPPLVSNLLSQTDYDGQLDFTYGALMANQNCDNADVKVVNTYTTAQWNWDTSYTVFAYEGEIYLQKGQKLSIFGKFDDGTAAVVDGVTLFAQGNNSGFNKNPAVWGVVYEAAETGWYPLNAWVWDWSSGKNCMTPPSALSYNFSGITTINDQNRDQWKHLEDTDGKGSFLRFKDPSKKLMTLGVPATNGVDVTINAAFAEVPGAAKFVAYVSMSHDGGLDPLAWDDVVKIADIAAGDTAAADYTVKGLASYPFVRFAIESEGSISTAERCRNFRQMSYAVGFGSDGLSLIVTDPVFAKTNGTFNVIVADTGAVTPLSLNVEVSSDPAFGSTVYQGTIDGIVYPGRFPVAINGLTPGTTYYVRVKPTTAGDDAWVVSAPIETEVFGNLRINEIMASNGDTFKTKSGRSGLDWIEIYNGTDEEVDLAGWYLYDDPSKAQSKWKKIQGACVIPVHGYGIVWCDKDYTGWDAANEAWSPIGLSTSGETVFLAKPDGTVVDTVTFGTQMKEISYGVGKLPGSDEETHVFFKVSTPGAENGEYGYGPMTPSVAFSVPHGYKTAPINVAITCADDPDADIYYTLDGTQPTPTNPKAVKYTGTEIPISSTTILRAGVPQENTVLQIDSSATYIYLNDVLIRPRAMTGENVPEGFPESGFNGHTMRYGMIQSIVNGTDRERILRGFTNTVATLSIVTDPDCLFAAKDGIYVNPRLYMNEGENGERPMLLEQIDPVNGAANEFSVPGGLRLRGAGSRDVTNAKHAFRFFFRGKYGMPKLNFPLFGEEGADEFSKVDLRCSQNYSWSYNDSDCETFVHEVFSRDSQRDLGQAYTRSRYYNLFVNGQYWGLYQTQERGDEDFAETYLGGNKDYYDCIKTWTESQWSYKTSAKNGNDIAWKQLQGLAYNGFSGDYIDNYNKALGLNPDGSRNEAYPILLNPENLMAYVTIAHFVCDADGPVSVNMYSQKGGLNNLYANRYEFDGQSDLDGFWFLRHDAEHSMGVSNRNEGTFAPWTQYTSDPTGLGTYEGRALSDDPADNERWRGQNPAVGENRDYQSFGPYQLHWELAKNPVYRRAFADYFYKHYLKEGGAMTPAVAKQRFQARMAEIDDVIVSEAARWSRDVNNPKSRETWLSACSNCLDFIDNRIAYMKPQYQARGWYPMINPPQPDVPAGVTTNDTVVTFTVKDDEGVTVDDCEVYITTDGSDPAESANASATITLATLPMTLNVRAKKNGEWSALETVAYQPAIAGGDGYTFVFEGSFEGDQTIAPTGSECVVIFNNATIDGTFTLPDNVKVYLCPSNGTENSVSSIIGPNANLTLRDPDGLGGSVSLEGGDTLISISNLVVKSGVLNLVSTGVSATKTPIVNVLGHVKQDGGVINLDSSAVSDDPAMQSYGIYVANKDPEDADGKNLEIIYAEFNGGEFNAKVGGWKSAALYINKGSVEATFNEGSTNHVELVGPEARFVNAAGDLNLKGGEFDVTMPVDCTSITNARVFKSDKEIKIKGGHYDVNVPGPGAEIFSAVKDKKDSIITVKDGTFELVADDDCFSADDRIDIQGGLFYAVSLNNDVFDSNGDMLISGGTIMAYATATGHEAFDVEPMVQGTEVSTFLPHQLTISGGTIFATGGKDAAWPENTVAGTGVNLYKVTGVDADGISEMYASIQGSQQIEGTEDTYDVTTTAKLPAFEKNGNALLMTCPNMADGAVPTFSAVAPTEGSQDFHDLYISSNLPSNHEYVRMYEIYGSTNDGAGGDTGEYIILTNVSDKVVQLAGLNVTSAKYDKKKDKIETPKVNITLTEGTLAAGASIKLEQSDFTDKGWEKITNGTIYFQIIDDKGTVVQSGFGAFDDELFPKTDGGGAAIRAKRFDNETELAATVDDWGSTAKAVSGLMFYVW